MRSKTGRLSVAGTALCCVLATGTAVAGTGTDRNAPGPAAKSSSQVSLAQRIQIAADIRSAVTRYFAHWQGLPAGDDFAADFKAYTKAIAASGDRRDFDLATKTLLAHLHNGHTGFEDTWLDAHDGGPLGVSVERLAGRWLVTASRRPGIAPGDVITHIDGQPIDGFYDGHKRYLAASSDRARAGQLFLRPFLFPRTVVLGLADGRSVTIERAAPLLAPKPPKFGATDQTAPWPAGVYYHVIPSFDSPTYEQAALAFVKAHRHAKTLVLDVRGNGGGTTPQRLIEALMTRAYRSMSEASALSVGLLAAYGNLADRPVLSGDQRIEALAETMKTFFSRPMMYWPGQVVLPKNPIYRGRLIVLIDRHCASACEDLLMPLKTGHRATLIGQTSYGSTGQPYVKNYANGMSFRVSAKRESFGDGRVFEGVGIRPDIAITPTADDLAQGHDPVLARAHALVRRSVPPD